MYSLKNGILYENGKAVFCLGLSYYPSYHERKVPVPADGDRIGEMKKDISGMKKAGFNLVRFASIGDVKRVDGNIVINTDFVDKMLDEADEVGIATMVRLQGYSMNFSGYDDFYMIKSDGKTMDKSLWYDFIQNSLFHQGILKDNDEGTVMLAKHYCEHKNLVSFQTYNEPHYPSHGVYDYHPDTIKAYRKWLVANGLKSEEEAKDYNPPVVRPQKDEDITEWVNWRVFSIDALSNFLNHSAEIAKAVDESKESCTCLTTDPVLTWNSERCVSYFDNAEGMDIVGITHYINTNGSPYFNACLVLDNAESAAALHGKHCWLIEYDARTSIPLRKFYEETYMAIGAGLKGIMYYQWRGDYIFPDSPEGNGFGFINYDGSQTDLYKEKMQMISLLNELSDYIVNAEKLRCGVAILYSKYAFCSADAIDNGEKTEKNSFLNSYKIIYKQLRQNGLTVDLVESKDLKENKLNIKVLYVPEFDLLSESEKRDVCEFSKTSCVYCMKEDLQYHSINEEYDRYTSAHNIEDTIEINDLMPVAKVNNSFVMAQVIDGDDYSLISLNNVSTTKLVQENIIIKLQHRDIKTAKLYTPSERTELRVENGHIYVPQIKEGAFVLCK